MWAKLPLANGRHAAIPLLVVALSLAHGSEARAEPESPRPFHHLGLTANLLAPVTSTYQVSAEWMVTERDSITLAPWYASGHTAAPVHQSTSFYVSIPDPSYAVDFTGEGIDLQYRRYFLDWVGGSGLFVAPGFDMALFAVDGKGVSKFADDGYHPAPGEGFAKQRFAYLGPTADVGFQLVLAVGFTFGGSLGMRYRFVSGEQDTSVLPSSFDTAHGPGFGVRARAWVGWSFL